VFLVFIAMRSDYAKFYAFTIERNLRKSLASIASHLQLLHAASPETIPYSQPYSDIGSIFTAIAHKKHLPLFTIE
jgi:hypothetical protein